MTPHPPPPDEAYRREIFAALVAAQDRAKSMHEAKQGVVARFGVTWQAVDRIEKEGLTNGWPPLGERCGPADPFAKEPLVTPHPPPPDEAYRREIFAALVAAQDRARSMHEAKQGVVARFGVTWQAVDRIEKEGLANEWPPLGD